jgi:hypothetical protein
MSSPRVTTLLLPPAKGRSIGGDSRRLTSRGRSAATAKLGKIRGPLLGRIQRPLRKWKWLVYESLLVLDDEARRRGQRLGAR